MSEEKLSVVLMMITLAAVVSILTLMAIFG